MRSGPTSRPCSSAREAAWAGSPACARRSPPCPPPRGSGWCPFPPSRPGSPSHALQEAVAKPYAPRGLKLRSHLSHWYPWGAMIYGRFVLPDGGPDAVTLHDRIWKDGVTAALGAGAVINDHHGVGLKLAPYMPAQHGAGLDVLRRIKVALDPNGVMNPGKLGL